MPVICQTLVLSPVPALFHWKIKATPWEQLLFLFFAESMESMCSHFAESAFWVKPSAWFPENSCRAGEVWEHPIDIRAHSSPLLTESGYLTGDTWTAIFKLLILTHDNSGKVTLWKPASEFALKSHVSIFIMKMISGAFLIIGIWYILP